MGETKDADRCPACGGNLIYERRESIKKCLACSHEYPLSQPISNRQSRPTILDGEKKEILKSCAAEQIEIDKIATAFKISRRTVYRYLGDGKEGTKK